MAFVHQATANVALIFAMGIFSGYAALLYADVRSSYPKESTGRALSIYTMSMFLGVALMQSLSGVVAGIAERQGSDIYKVVMLMIAGMLVAGAMAYRFLPASPLLKNTKH